MDFQHPVLTSRRTSSTKVSPLLICWEPIRLDAFQEFQTSGALRFGKADGLVFGVLEKKTLPTKTRFQHAAIEIGGNLLDFLFKMGFFSIDKKNDVGYFLDGIILSYWGGFAWLGEFLLVIGPLHGAIKISCDSMVLKQCRRHCLLWCTVSI